MSVTVEFDVNANIRAMVRMLVAHRAIKLEDLAAAIGMKTSTIYGRMKKDRSAKDATDFSAAEVYRIAAHFGVKPEVFYEPLPQEYGGTTDRYLGEILGEITPPDDPPSRPNRRAIPGGVESVRHRRSSVIPALRQPEAEHRQPSRQRSAAVPARNRATGAAVRAAA